MSFQRMLMMAAREPRPYLPHPEAVEALYIPRWQPEDDRAHLRDYSGKNRNMRLIQAEWSAESLLLTNNTRAYTPSGGMSFGDNVTVIADRDVSNSTANARGFMLSTLQGVIYLTIEERTASRYIIRNFGVNNTINIAADGWMTYRRTDYCGQPIAAGSAAANNSRISFAGTSGVPTWQSCRALAMWSISLTDEEIEMAKLFLSTASLEDYMMSRL